MFGCPNRECVFYPPKLTAKHEPVGQNVYKDDITQ